MSRFLVAALLLFSPSLHAAGWPRAFSSNGTAFAVYQPQVLSWSGNQLTARAAVSVTPQGAAGPKFGTVTISGATAVDNAAGTVSLSDVGVSAVSFPSLPDEAAGFGSVVAAQASQWARDLPLGAVKANLAVTTAEGGGAKPVPVKNPVPVIFFSESPAVLVLVDGEPALRPVDGTSLLRAINTSSLLVMDPSSGNYLLRVNGGWLAAATLAGPWAVPPSLPDGLETVLASVASNKGMQLFDPPAGTTPATPGVFVSTVPAELITTQGAPDFQPIPGTQLLHVANSASSIFMNIPTQAFYIVISGRWFTATTLTATWTFVPADALPADFAAIPESHPAGVVLASVAGTPQAAEAVVSAGVPQTATIARSTTTSVTYDGAPRFQPIAGTDMSYAVNTATPVVATPGGEFYALENGVWFFAAAPLGPWRVADRIPAVIYSIPPESPIFYATNVVVYSATPDVVTVGYTPGYFGPCVAPEGVVVFGTGYAYPPYIGTDVWIGPPLTYGFGAGFACGLATGFAFGVAVDHGWGCSPWWGPWHGGWNGGNWNNVNINRTNVYNRWGGNVVNNTVNNTNVSKTNVNTAVDNARNDANNWKSTHSGGDHPDASTLRSDASSRLGDNNVFAGSDGHAYRSGDDGSWQRSDGSRWSDAGDMDSDLRGGLDDDRFARGVGGFRGGFRR